jgi:hypothetical protein
VVDGLVQPHQRVADVAQLPHQHDAQLAVLEHERVEPDAVAEPLQRVGRDQCVLVGFSVANRRTSTRTSAAARGRPCRPRRERQFQ